VTENVIPHFRGIKATATFTAGSGECAVEIDSDIVSGRDNGQIVFDPEVADWALDMPFDDTRRAGPGPDGVVGGRRPVPAGVAPFAALVGFLAVNRF
jgi:hypothetical protein